MLFDGIISRLHAAKDRISEAEDMWTETSKTAHKEKTRMKEREQNMQSLRNNYKSHNISVVEIPEAESEKRAQEIFEVMIENFQKLMKCIKE